MWWIPLAIADSLGPCTTAALIVIIAYAITERRSVLLVSFSYIFGLLFGYMLLGFAAYYGFRLLSPLILRYLVYILCGLVIFLALKNLYSAYRDYVGDDVGCVVCKKDNLLKKATSPVVGFLVGFLFAFTLLPCSMGPYIAFITRLSYVGGSPLLIVLYNIVFGWIYYVIAIFSYGMVNVSVIQKWLYRYSYIFNIFSGMVLLLFSLWMLKTV